MRRRPSSDIVPPDLPRGVSWSRRPAGIQPVPALLEFMRVALQSIIVNVSQAMFPREGRPSLDIGDEAGGNEIRSRDRPLHFSAANFPRVELYQGGGIQIEDHLRSSSTISASDFSPGPITIGRNAPRILPPFAGSIPGIRRRRRATFREFRGAPLRVGRWSQRQQPCHRPAARCDYHIFAVTGLLKIQG